MCDFSWFNGQPIDVVTDMISFTRMACQSGEELAITTAVSGQVSGYVFLSLVDVVLSSTACQSVFVFLTIVSSGLQYFIQRFNYQRDLKRIEHVVREARLAAWGGKMVPVEGQRKVTHTLHTRPNL